MYETYEQDHRALDVAFDVLNQAVSAHDPLETARATKAFKFHLDLHLDKEDAHMYRLISERVSLPEQGQAVGLMASHAPQDRFPEVVAWMFPLIGHDDRVNMTRSWQMGMPPEGFVMAAHAHRAGRSATTGPSSPGTSPSSFARNAVGTRSTDRASRSGMETTMNTQQDLIADPSNAGQVGAWDGNEGAFWTAQARRFDETLANCHGPFLDRGGHSRRRPCARRRVRQRANHPRRRTDRGERLRARHRSVVADARTRPTRPPPPKVSTTSSSDTPTRRSTRSRTPRSTP